MDFDDVVALSAALSQLPCRSAYLNAVQQELLHLIPADDVLWIQAADVRGTGCVVMRGQPWTLDPELSGALSRHWTRHATPRWATAHLTERQPFRVSDIIAPRRWREDETFRELKFGMPEYQLNIAPPPPARYQSWVLIRERADFTDDEVARATGLAPVLASLGLMYDRLEPQRATVNQGPNAAGLTPRELSVLAVLAQALPADAMARRLGIAERTVGKHLEHVYRKLKCGDRLVAVTRARALNLLPPAGADPSVARMSALKAESLASLKNQSRQSLHSTVVLGQKPHYHYQP